MEFLDSTEKEAQVLGAHNPNAHNFTHSYAYEEGETEEEGQSPTTNSPAPLGSPLPINSEIPPRHHPPTADVRVIVMKSSTPQPVPSSSKKGGSIFSVSSLYDLGSNGSLQIPSHLKLIEVALRSAAAVFSLITFCVMTSTREMRMASGSTFEVKFSDFQAYNYLVALNVLAFVYSSAQVVVILQSNNSSIFASPMRSGICKYFCDEILAFCLFSASSSAATASELALHGLHNLWPPACSTWKLWMFCSKADAAVVISFFSSFSVILSSLFSGFYLLRLVALV
eukprot:c21954_g2_i1 orf=139-987(-)